MQNILNNLYLKRRVVWVSSGSGVSESQRSDDEAGSSDVIGAEESPVDVGLEPVPDDARARVVAQPCKSRVSPTRHVSRKQQFITNMSQNCYAPNAR